MTSRTNSPSEAAHGTARLPNPSTTLSKEVEEVVAELTDQARRYNDPTLRQAADLLTRISAERDRLEEALQHAHAKVTSACEQRNASDARAASEGSDAAAARKRVRELVAQVAGLEQANTVLGEKVQRAEAERDALKADLSRQREAYAVTAGEARKAKADLSALKARVAEVLEPFAKAHDQWIAAASPNVPDDHELNIMGSTVGHFRRATELHATLSGEQK